MKIENRQQVLAAVAITAIALLLLDRVVFTPMTKSWKQRSDDIVQLEDKIRKGRDLMARANVMGDRWDQMKTNALAADTAERVLIDAFQRWSRESGASVSSIQPQWKMTDEDYSTLECRANISGAVGSLSKFIYNIEKDAIALRIEELEIAAKDDNGQNLTLGLQVSGLVFNPPAE
jgi:hypothetical protein